MKAWPSASYDEAFQPDLFSTSGDRRRPPVIRCWLAFDHEDDDIDAALVLAERRHLIVDAFTGETVVGDDLILMPNRARDELLCLGPDWLAHALPDNFRRRGLAFWSNQVGHSSLPLFRRPPWVVACFALDHRPGRPTGWATVGAAAAGRQALRRASGPSKSYVGRRETANLLDALVQFELGRTLAASAVLREPRIERAKWHLRRAADSFAAAGSLAWTEVAHRHVSALDRELFRARQPDIPGLLTHGQEETNIRLRRLGLGVRALSIVPLPPVPLLPHHILPEVRSGTGRRRALCMVPLHRPTLRRLLPAVGRGWLTGRIALDGEALQEGRTLTRLGKGQSVDLSALLDSEIYQTLRLASREPDAESMIVFADGAGVSLSPRVKSGRVGHPVMFKATARESGKHSIRFTFLTSGRIVSKIHRTIEVTEG